MHRSNKCRGFTLVEILCVVVILGIAAGIIIPQLGMRHDLKAAAAARMLISDLMYAQNLAISKQRKHYIQFVDQQYTLMSRDSDSDPLSAISHPVTKNTYTVGMGSATPGLDGVSLAGWEFGGPSIIGFDDLGSPFAYDGTDVLPLNDPAKITIQSGDVSLVVSIEPYTGEASAE